MCKFSLVIRSGTLPRSIAFECDDGHRAFAILEREPTGTRAELFRDGDPLAMLVRHHDRTWEIVTRRPAMVVESPAAPLAHDRSPVEPSVQSTADSDQLVA